MVISENEHNTNLAQFVNISRDCVQSANSLFHFMKKKEYLLEYLTKRYLMPRYYSEDISHLELEQDGTPIREIMVLQKCFCEMQLHQLREVIQIKVDDNGTLREEDKRELSTMTHPQFYGKYAIAFNKIWGIEKGLQALQYSYKNSEACQSFGNVFNDSISKEDISDALYDDIVTRLCFSKCIRGKMKYHLESGNTIEVEKNYTDEREWRFVPDAKAASHAGFERLITESSGQFGEAESINEAIRKAGNEAIRLGFDYSDVKYIIVPDNSSRIELLGDIEKLPDKCFTAGQNRSIDLQKHLLMSKILVLSEGEEDW